MKWKSKSYTNQNNNKTDKKSKIKHKVFNWTSTLLLKDNPPKTSTLKISYN